MSFVSRKYLFNFRFRSFPSHFDENLMFNETTAAELKIDFREKFRNISKIMDCVGCDKCRLWGKIQVIFTFIHNVRKAKKFVSKLKNKKKKIKQISVCRFKD